MELEDLKNKNIALLGFGSENRALLDFFIKKKLPARITICDQNINLRPVGRGQKTPEIKYALGPEYDKALKVFDVIFRVAGYPLFKKELREAKKAGAIISSPIRFFVSASPTANIIGVTGTKGKGTTSGLIHKILQAAGKQVFWGGNVGIPVFSFFSKLKKDSWVVLELSSFQLEDMDTNPKIALITNIGREHLAPADPANPNYHRTYEDYCRAKFNIIKYQKRNDFAVLNANLKGLFGAGGRGKLEMGNGKKIYFKRSDLASRLVGEHNRENVAAAVAAAKLAGVREGIIRKAVKKYRGLPHRIEPAGVKNGIKYYDDSFATTPESGMIALDSFNAPIILLAGGADKGSDFKKFARRIKKKVKFLILFEGQGTEKLKKELSGIAYDSHKLKTVNSMARAFKYVVREAKPGDTVLLSPGCASFGVFNNYKERGDKFKSEADRIA